MSVISVKNSVINKSEIKVKKVKDYTDEERKKILSKFFDYETLGKFGKGKILGDIVSPLYKEV
jgi:hypothetical protein